MRSRVGILVAGVAFVAGSVALPASAAFANQDHPGGPAPNDHLLGAAPRLECPPLCIPDLGPPLEEGSLLWEALRLARREFEGLFP